MDLTREGLDVVGIVRRHLELACPDESVTCELAHDYAEIVVSGRLGRWRVTIEELDGRDE